MQISDEMVEKAARCFYEMKFQPGAWASANKAAKAQWMRRMRAAIEAVAPAIREEALDRQAERYERKAKELYEYLKTRSHDDMNWTGILADEERRKRRDMDARLTVYMEEAAALRAMIAFLQGGMRPPDEYALRTNRHPAQGD